jgi:hypothetical protein
MNGGKRHSYTQIKPINRAKNKTTTRCSNEDRLDGVSSRLVWKVSLGGDFHPCMHHAAEQNNHTVEQKKPCDIATPSDLPP